MEKTERIKKGRTIESARPFQVQVLSNVTRPGTTVFRGMDMFGNTHRNAF